MLVLYTGVSVLNSNGWLSRRLRCFGAIEEKLLSRQAISDGPIGPLAGERFKWIAESALARLIA